MQLFMVLAIMLLTNNVFAKKKKKLKTQSDFQILNIKKDFGAKGDGITNDQAAFELASLKIKELKQNVTLLIPTGIYIVGNQIENQSNELSYFNTIYLEDCKNIEIVGEGKVILKSKPNMKFGSFDPTTFKKIESSMNFYKPNYRKDIGDIIYLKNCDNVLIKNLELDGNINKMKIGGTWGDTGYQLIHDGIILFDCNKIEITKMNVHHFGKDGIMIGNKNEDTFANNQIKISDCVFEYNGRQGFSWIGGSGLTVNNCKFAHTGQNGVVSSLPGAGIDIESEWCPITNGKFINCKIENNNGCGFLADSGPSSNVLIDSCIIVAPIMWSVWITKPNYTIKNTKICGSIVHGFDANNDTEATKFENCSFNEKLNDKIGYGNFLIEVNGIKRIQFTNCQFTAHSKKLMWIDGTSKWKTEEMPIFKNCKFTQTNLKQIINNDYLFVARVSNFKNCEFTINEKKENMRGIFMQNAGSNWSNDIKINYLK